MLNAESMKELTKLSSEGAHIELDDETSQQRLLAFLCGLIDHDIYEAAVQGKDFATPDLHKWMLDYPNIMQTCCSVWDYLLGDLSVHYHHIRYQFDYTYTTEYSSKNSDGPRRGHLKQISIEIKW